MTYLGVPIHDHKHMLQLVYSRARSEFWFDALRTSNLVAFEEQDPHEHFQPRDQNERRHQGSDFKSCNGPSQRGPSQSQRQSELSYPLHDRGACCARHRPWQQHGSHGSPLAAQSVAGSSQACSRDQRRRFPHGTLPTPSHGNTAQRNTTSFYKEEAGASHKQRHQPNTSSHANRELKSVDGATELLPSSCCSEQGFEETPNGNESCTPNHQSLFSRPFVAIRSDSTSTGETHSVSRLSSSGRWTVPTQSDVVPRAQRVQRSGTSHGNNENLWSRKSSTVSARTSPNLFEPLVIDNTFLRRMGFSHEPSCSDIPNCCSSVNSALPQLARVSKSSRSHSGAAPFGANSSLQAPGRERVGTDGYGERQSMASSSDGNSTTSPQNRCCTFRSDQATPSSDLPSQSCVNWCSQLPCRRSSSMHNRTVHSDGTSNTPQQSSHHRHSTCTHHRHSTCTHGPARTITATPVVSTLWSLSNSHYCGQTPTELIRASGLICDSNDLRDAYGMSLIRILLHAGLHSAVACMGVEMR